ncbi:hypothetical protein QJS66_00890 [Kocuria rhizophila]|nr:hypothetical protein QJS66_00890 [Kocuria rhizophila]
MRLPGSFICTSVTAGDPPRHPHLRRGGRGGVHDRQSYRSQRGAADRAGAPGFAAGRARRGRGATGVRMIAGLRQRRRPWPWSRVCDVLTTTTSCPWPPWNRSPDRRGLASLPGELPADTRPSWSWRWPRWRDIVLAPPEALHAIRSAERAASVPAGLADGPPR